MPSRRSDLSELIAGLNEDLANEYASVIQYRTYASTVRGPHRLTLRPFFEGEVADELSHAGLLADRIAAFGGTPTTRPAHVSTASTALEMLQQAHQAELGALARYVARREQAEAVGEHGLAVSLDDVIADETRHRDEMQLMIQGWEDAAHQGDGARERARSEPTRRKATVHDREVTTSPR
ncbi:MAG TPA: ferritin-like domain-containing protein [Gemmatimonadaceae bacterium]